MKDRENIDGIFMELGFNDYKWINSKDIVVSNWVRVKCTFGCSEYGLSVCPPNVPDVNDCKSFFAEYTDAILIRFRFMADRESYPADYSRKITQKLLDLERLVFLQGFPKAFVFNQTCCGVCVECVKNRMDCRNLKKSRPSPEAFAMDVFTTAKQAGFDIDVIKTKTSEINRFGLLMIA